MATNTTLQYLESTGEDAFGNSVSLGSKLSNRRQVETFMSKGAITAGAPVGFDFSATVVDGDVTLEVVQSDTTAGATVNCVGIALNAASGAGEKVDVCISGICEAVIATGISVGDRLKATTPAGKLDGYVNTDTVPSIAYAVDANSSGSDATRTVVVIKQF